jgi:uncharacterized membrane protein YedE/YeeE
MVGAIAIGSVAFLLAKRRQRSLLGLPMQLPTNTVITPRLVIGSALFGIGWGTAGFCPGPALVALGAGYPKAIGFVLAMAAGMLVFEVLERSSARRARLIRFACSAAGIAARSGSFRSPTGPRCRRRARS